MSEDPPAKGLWNIGLKLRTINYKYLNDNSDKPAKAKEQYMKFIDDNVLSYYQNPYQRKIIPFFTQRISDSSTYIILFPTGLLLLVTCNPLVIQAKLQLNLKRDESLVDIMYCVSVDRKY